MFDPPLKPDDIKFVGPSRKERDKGLAQVRNCLFFWKANPAYLLLKPNLGLIVSLLAFDFDDQGFELTFSVDEVLIAPEDFDPLQPTTLSFGWNQPYLGIGTDGISAPYHCGLHFGARGVQNIRELRTTRFFEAIRKTDFLLGFLRTCFDPGYEAPPEGPTPRHLPES